LKLEIVDGKSLPECKVGFWEFRIQKPKFKNQKTKIPKTKIKFQNQRSKSEIRDQKIRDISILNTKKK